MMDKWAGRVVLALAVVVAAVAKADNAITQIEITAADPADLCVGDTVTYKAIVNGADPLVGAVWEFKSLDKSPPEDYHGWIGSGSFLSVTDQESRVGSFRIRITATFRRYPMQQTYAVQKEIDVMINPPNRIEINPIHLDVPVPLVQNPDQPNFAVTFKLGRGNRNVYAQGVMLEKLQRTKYGKFPDMNWFIPSFLSSTGPGEVTDWKGLYIAADQLPGWNAMGLGWVADEFDQSLRIRLQKGAGGTGDYDLAPTYHFQFQKVDNGSWKLHRVD